MYLTYLVSVVVLPALSVATTVTVVVVPDVKVIDLLKLPEDTVTEVPFTVTLLSPLPESLAVPDTV